MKELLVVFIKSYRVHCPGSMPEPKKWRNGRQQLHGQCSSISVGYKHLQRFFGMSLSCFDSWNEWISEFIQSISGITTQNSQNPNHISRLTTNPPLRVYDFNNIAASVTPVWKSQLEGFQQSCCHLQNWKAPAMEPLRRREVSVVQQKSGSCESCMVMWVIWVPLKMFYSSMQRSFVDLSDCRSVWTLSDVPFVKPSNTHRGIWLIWQLDRLDPVYSHQIPSQVHVIW